MTLMMIVIYDEMVARGRITGMAQSGRTGQGGSLRWTRHRIPSCQSILTDLLTVPRQEPLRALPRTSSKTKLPAKAQAG